MLDPLMVRLIARPINRVGGLAANRGVTADQVTIVGFGIGMCALPALALNQYGMALVFILLNRLADGLDGAIARATSPTDFGAYLDIVLDFIFYASVVVGFALANPDTTLAAVILLASFVGTGASFLAFAVIAAKRGLDTEARGKKSFFYSGGVAEGTETILFFIIVCVWPEAFIEASSVFIAMCWITVAMRIAQTRRTFKTKVTE